MLLFFRSRTTQLETEGLICQYRVPVEDRCHNELKFTINLSYSPLDNIAVLSWDQARHLSTPHLRFSNNSGALVSVLEKNVYLFEILVDCLIRQHGYVYSEKNFFLKFEHVYKYNIFFLKIQCISAD